MGATHCVIWCVIGTHQMTPAAIGPRCHWSVPTVACHWACHWDTPNGTLATSSCVSLGPASASLRTPPPLSSPSCPRARVPFGVSRWHLVSPRAIWCVPLAHPVGTPFVGTPFPGHPVDAGPASAPCAPPPVGANGTQWHASAASAVDRRSPAPISVPVPLFRPKLALIGSSVRCVSDFRPSELSSHAVLQRKSSFSLPWGHATQKIGGIHRTEQPISATKRRKSGSEGR